MTLLTLQPFYTRTGISTLSKMHQSLLLFKMKGFETEMCVSDLL